MDLFGRPLGGRVLVIAEVGTAHGGDLERARALVDAAAEAGADCAKFQAVWADEILHPLAGGVDLPGGRVPLYERFRELERPEGFYRELKSYTEERGLAFLCSAFGLRSARLLRGLGVQAVKVASPELNHFPLLAEVAGYGLPLLLSTGVSTLGDIERALEVTGREVVLLHCLTAYPAPEEEYNLRLIPNLARIFGLPVGLSDHSLDPLLVPVLATALGAPVLEKHITLSRGAAGLDDPIALEPDDFARMVEGVRRAERLGAEGARAWMEELRGAERVRQALGSGVKELAPSERGNYLTTHRSVHALRAIRAGEVLGEKDFAALRSEKNLRPGLDPGCLPLLAGRRARRDIPDGDGIGWEQV